MTTVQTNPDLLNDLNTLMRCIKKRQQLHLQLLDYIKKIINVKEVDQFAFFLDQELRIHKNFFHETSQKHQNFRQDEQKVKLNYQSNRFFESSELKLINRLCMRIMEICQASYEKIKQYFEFYDDFYKQFSVNLVKMLQSEKVDLITLLNIILSYSHNKFQQDLKELEKIITMIENGQRNNISGFITQRTQRRIKKIEIQKKKKEIQLQADKKIRKEKEKASQRIAKMWEEAKNIEIARKKKNKFIQKICNTVYGVLEPSKHQMMEDMNYVKKDDQYNRLYTEIFEKNKFNYMQILDFSSKSDDFKEKIKKFKQMMLNSNLKSSKLTPRRKSRQDSTKASELHKSSQDIKLDPPACINTNQQQKFQPALQYQEEREYVSQKQITLHSNPKISRKSLETKIETNSLKKIERNYLPQITTNQIEKRERYDSVLGNKARRLSQTKNVQIGDNPGFKADLKMMPVSNIQINMESKFEIRLQELKKKQPIPKAFEYTFYMKKKVPQSKFNETKNNFLL